jgi:hypothetical protein
VKLWETFQDRLINELSFEVFTKLEGANEYLHFVFLFKYNRKFTRKLTVEEVVYKTILEGIDLDRTCSLKQIKQVHLDQTTSYKVRKNEILPTKIRFSLVMAYIEVDKYLDDSIHIFYQGKEFKYRIINILGKKIYFL